MEYTKIKILSKDDPKRFYRVLAVQGDPDLYELGAMIGLSVRAWFEHWYCFSKKRVSYLPDIWMEDAWGESYPMSRTHLSDLGDQFTYEYDTGESWNFDCRVLKRKFQYQTDDEELPMALVLEGKGQGIFENNHETLWRYLRGEIDPNSSEESEENWQFLPTNMEFETYGDFDAPLDLEKLMFYEFEVHQITDHFNEAPEENDDEEDDDAEQDFFNDMVLNQVAGMIFNDGFTNKVFRRLIKTHDINEAYEMIVQCVIGVLAEAKENVDEEQLGSVVSERLENLK